MMNKEKKEILPAEIAILVLSTQDIKYRGFYNAISSGWAESIKRNNIKLYFYSGNYAESKIINDRILVKTKDNLKHTSEKLLTALRILIQYHPEIKLVYRTNLSSYIEVENFLKFIANKQLDEDTYAGFVGETTYLKEFFYGRSRYLTKLFTHFQFGKKIRFASGSGFFMGRRVINRLITSRAPQLSLIDDVMVARTLDIEPDSNAIPLRFNIEADGAHKISGEEYRGLIEKGLLFHYRFKTSNRNNDIEMLNSFNSAINRNKICTFNK